MLMIAIRMSAQLIIADMRQADQSGPKQSYQPLARFANQIMAGKCRKNQDGNTQSAKHKNRAVFMAATTDKQADRTQGDNRPQQPDMESLITENCAADCRKHTQRKGKPDTVQCANG